MFSSSSSSSSSLLPHLVKRKQKTSRMKDRANMSFFIVVMFFAVFGVIVLTEIFLIDDKTKSVTVRHNSIVSGKKSHDKLDYDEQDDYAFRNVPGNPFSFMRGHPRPEDKSGDGKYHGSSGQDPYVSILSSGQTLSPEAERELPPPPMNLNATDGVWKPVGKTRFKFYVYSAYFDRRDKRYVRVIAATKTRGPERVWCRLYYPRNAAAKAGLPTSVYSNTTNNNASYVSITVMAKIKVIRENWNLKYSACFVLCPLRKEIGPPEMTAIVSRLRARPSHLLRVRNTDQDPDFMNRSATQIPKKMAVCVKPFHYHYDQSLNILEFLELYSIMGIDHFFMYKHTLGEHVSCLLKDYESSGKLTMMPWDLNMLSQKEIRTECQFAAFNDCLYRAMYRYSHVALVDLDEFIIPNHNYTLPDMLKWLSGRLNTWSTGSFSFQNAFFYLQWGDDPSVYNTVDRVETGLITSRKTRRRAKLHPHKQRSKYICRPELVVEAGNHFVWEFIPGHGTLNVPSDAAILHHYRVCEFGGDDCIKTASAVDQTAYKYKTELVERVGRKYDSMKLTCQLPDLPPPPTPPPVKKKKRVVIINKPKIKEEVEAKKKL